LNAKYCVQQYIAMRTRNRRPATTLYPRRRVRPMPILGMHGGKAQLHRLTFGKFKVQLTRDELNGLNARAERYLRETGTMFGFARSLLHV
jgi:hypothetical protein